MQSLDLHSGAGTDGSGEAVGVGTGLEVGTAEDCVGEIEGGAGLEVGAVDAEDGVGGIANTNIRRLCNASKGKSDLPLIFAKIEPLLLLRFPPNKAPDGEVTSTFTLKYSSGSSIPSCRSGIAMYSAAPLEEPLGNVTSIVELSKSIPG